MKSKWQLKVKKIFAACILVVGLGAVFAPSVSSMSIGRAGTIQIAGGTWRWSGYGNYQCTSDFYHRGKRHQSTAIGHNTVVSRKSAMHWTHASARPWAGLNQAFYAFY